ncbi:hypothetical protein DAPPUDRAFT_41708 [Daphnia pulex]|uniref:Syntaxin-binding protein 5-like n=1 Tax=Daphnia pulex TaxID=6669 RepID=E9FVU1_DAPPU|nr:hypothetical protein DAPPUDRAFT_41708 [Daphnia pulex]|eukprot:EFX88611.1 hypothetical protein DAPPUDRAFT_41708 [Daphnia pulex]
MKRFTFKGVLDNFRQSVSQPTKSEQPELVETLKTEHCQLARTARHGFPHQPTALAYDPIQRLVAIGTKSGAIRILGRPGVSVQVRHDPASGSGHHPSHGTFSTTGPAVIQLQFLINEGALVSATSDDSLHLWNIRQKRPDIVHSLKFQRERITCFHLPFQSKWLYVGTERGNVHIVNIESFSLSGYVINWNKAIELSCKTHPGPVIHISDCPTDPSKLLMGFESGLVVLWDLRTKVADSRFIASEPLRSVSWLSDGKQLISAHTDGSLYTWNSRAGPRPAPVSVTYPHAKGGREGKPECKAIQKVEWKSSTSGDPFVIFSGGLPQDRPGRSSSITVVHGRNTTVLEMEHNVVDFVALCDTPWTSAEEQDPHAIIVLLQNDLVIVDLLTPGFPCFENPYPMDIHESAVTCCLYMADCPGDLIPALYSVGAQGHTGFSKREWPINGGQWGSLAPSYAEIIVTGHVDGTVKFWDTSSLSLQVLYRLKTSKVFEKSRSKTLRPDGEHLAIKQLAMCPENRLLAIAGASGHVALFKFRRQEVSLETTVLGVPLFFDSTDEPQGSPSFGPGAANLEFCLRKEQPNPLSVRGGVYRRPPGFQVDLVCLSSWMDGEAPGSITALSVNSAYGLMAYGNDGGLVLIDIIQKSVLLSMASVDLYSSADPYTRLPRSPKRPTDSANSRAAADLDDNSVRSPSCDQVKCGIQISRTCGFILDKSDTAFTRSRSSSTSSLENHPNEAVTTLTFADTLARKLDTAVSASLWVGTSQGSVLVIVINLAAPGEPRLTQPVMVSPSGNIFRVKGSMLCVAFIEPSGNLISNPSEPWRDETKEARDQPARTGAAGGVGNDALSSDDQYTVMVSEKQARVVSLPSQTCLYRVNLAPAEGAFAVTANVVSLKDGPCLATFLSNGHIQVFSLPSLRPLMDVEFTPLVELNFQTSRQNLVDPMLNIWAQQQTSVNEDSVKIARNFRFTSHGHGMYLCSPSEMEKFTISSAFASTLGDLMGEMFMPCEMPEPPKEGFFKGLFGGGVRPLDREELFGESTGKAGRGVARHIPGPAANLETLTYKAGSVAAEVQKTRQALNERGDKLGMLEDRTQRMANEAENFSNAAHQLMVRCRERKWYQL